MNPNAHYMIESKRPVAMTRLSFIVILCPVGSSKTTLMRVGHYGRKNNSILRKSSLKKGAFP